MLKTKSLTGHLFEQPGYENLAILKPVLGKNSFHGFKSEREI